MYCSCIDAGMGLGMLDMLDNGLSPTGLD